MALFLAASITQAFLLIQQEINMNMIDKSTIYRIKNILYK